MPFRSTASTASCKISISWGVFPLSFSYQLQAHHRTHCVHLKSWPGLSARNRTAEQLSLHTDWNPEKKKNQTTTKPQNWKPLVFFNYPTWPPTASQEKLELPNSTFKSTETTSQKTTWVIFKFALQLRWFKLTFAHSHLFNVCETGKALWDDSHLHMEMLSLLSCTNHSTGELRKSSTQASRHDPSS